MKFKLQKLLAKLIGYLWHRHRFAAFGAGSFIIRPLSISGQQYISIGRGVRVRDHLRMEAISAKRSPELVIGDNTNVEQNVHIICSTRVRIGSQCSITANCCIVDTSHPFEGVGEVKFADLLNDAPAEVLIGDGSLIGFGAVILPNARLGRRCVVGAGAVVGAGDYPEGSVLVGAPARVVRQLRL